MRLSRLRALAMMYAQLSAFAAATILTVGCGNPHANRSPTTHDAAPVKDPAALAAEIRDHARYLDDSAAREDRRADELSKKVGPADEGILYRTRSLANELREQADEARRMADRIDASPDVVSDHYAAAGRLYRQEAQRLQAQAEAYEQQAASIRPLEDPKGFRRNELIMASQRNRQEADRMMTRYLTYATRDGRP